jgi:hypothetical protein
MTYFNLIVFFWSVLLTASYKTTQQRKVYKCAREHHHMMRVVVVKDAKHKRTEERDEKNDRMKKSDRGKQQQLIEGACIERFFSVREWRSFLRDERQAEDVVFLRFRCSNNPFLFSTTEAETQQVDKIWPSSVIGTRSLITTTILTTNKRKIKNTKQKENNTTLLQ